MDCMIPKPNTCCIYLRVSLNDGSQTVENQRPEVMALVKARGWDLIEVYEDRASAYGRRPAYNAMMEAGRRGRFRYCAVWSLDRLGRGLAAFDAYRTLSGQYGVTIASIKEPWTEVEGPQRDLLCAVAAWVAGYERTRLVERTRAGLERARRQGRRIGRPRASVDLQQAIRLRGEGLGLRSVARQVGCGATTLARLLRASQDLSASGPLAQLGGIAACSERGQPEGHAEVPGITVTA
jgi:DNA invertase Pin-like site-specific DNA recombinase